MNFKIAVLIANIPILAALIFFYLLGGSFALVYCYRRSGDPQFCKFHRHLHLQEEATILSFHFPCLEGIFTQAKS